MKNDIPADRSSVVQPRLEVVFDTFTPRELPTVSVAIPALNEAKYIDGVIELFSVSAYPRIVDILVVDGGSIDETQKKVEDWSSRDPRVRLLHNPHRFQSFALNLALYRSTGDVFLRADAHCIYANDYVERCVDALLKSSATNAGGAQRFIAANWVQAATSIAVRSFIASGGARYRRHDYDGYAETVFLGCFWRDAVLAVGGYSKDALVNEDYDLNARLSAGPFSVINVTNQDAELNMKLLRKNRRGVYISSDIKVWYWPRKTFYGLMVQYFKYGRGRALTSVKHGTRVSRGNTPFFALVGFGMSVLVEAILCHTVYVAGFIGALLLAALAFEALRITWVSRCKWETEIWRGAEQDKPSLGALAVGVWAVFIVTNVCHGVGFGYQLGRLVATTRWEKSGLRLRLRW